MSPQDPNMAPPPQEGMPPEEAAPQPLDSQGRPISARATSSPMEEVTPQEQEAYEMAMNAIGDRIYADEESTDALLDFLANSKTHEKTVAEITAQLVNYADQEMGGNIPETMILPLAQDVLPLVVELGETAGLFDFTDVQMDRTLAFVVKDLFDEYGVEEADLEQLMGELTPGEAKQVASHFKGVFGG